MSDRTKLADKPASGSDKNPAPDGGGDPHQKAQQWGGGSKGSKGPVTAQDRASEQSSSKS